MRGMVRWGLKVNVDFLAGGEVDRAVKSAADVEDAADYILVGFVRDAVWILR